MRFLFTSAPLDPKAAVTTLMIVATMQFPLSATPFTLMCFADGVASFRRIKTFLGLPETPQRKSNVAPVSKHGLVALRIADADICWSQSNCAILRSVNLNVFAGQSVALVGKIGEGKTCLLETLIGEEVPLKGSVEVYGSVGYCSQSAWIQSITIRENILFGNAFNRDWYNEVVHACCLEHDFAQLLSGDMTLVGEQGVNLSGGQKQRIALARVVYQRPEVVILDDVLSAVDHIVADKIMSRVFNKLLKGRTLIFATHRMNVLSHFSKIVVLESGQCLEFTSSEEALEKCSVFRELCQAHTDTHVPLEPETVIIRKRKESKESLAAQIVDEDSHIDVGATTRWRNLKLYIQSSGGFPLFTVLFFMCIGYCAIASSSGVYLSHFADHSMPGTHGFISSTKGSLVLLVIEMSHVTLMICFLIAFAFFSRHGSVCVHTALLRRIQNAKMKFFEDTPAGNILSRLSKDMAVVDSDLPMSLSTCMDEIGWMGSNFAIIMFLAPSSVLFVLPLAWFLRNTERTYSRAYSTIVRLTSALKSPVFTHVTETVSGITVIRAFGHQERFTNRFLELLANRIRATHTNLLGNRWIGARMEVANAIFTFCVSIACIKLVNSANVTYLAFAVSCATRMAGDLAWFVRQTALNDGNLVSISRVAVYNKETVCPQEPCTYNTDDRSFQTACVEFRNVCMRYSPELPLVLKHVTFKIPHGTKVGVIGRTGAGKTSLMSVLLRLLDIECGDILVDNRSIYCMSIGALRSGFAVIPQDPTLFGGTLRTNLDPFQQYSENEIRQVLQRVCLLDYVDSLPEGLDMPIDSSGSQLSFGQRQLLCLARVLLKNSLIILMDEATSSVDPATDALIQTCIKSDFASKTLITIAHRIQTIMDYDMVSGSMMMERFRQILGLAQGEVVEFDTPNRLLMQSDSLLACMLGRNSCEDADICLPPGSGTPPVSGSDFS
eukprot:Gregarina_sp_Poly_1__2550@NODE_1691_length_3530_cov_65_822697_g1111_i0_p1_GENE_NODE_1691_length_3530_cov_65_822697_g1111_i0NODE_1691_length_3530_cov_65_822697_g1111_i0_p1_ORF_typecomplete_len949_score112_49ABC_tran/PF00005_27/1_8e23ABC_tran/PF00005_27/2_2e32ABC_membrane/PF00664_23/1_9e30AAA_21/PF13304_6/0_012AAA_21/PF13304_6/0_016SMC_N/PF02463_19/0_0014SMC_N/PF02463_19/27SMC_N/PF02463_19/35DUF87/PF01935_17/1_1DUF87/PF01935_17/0_14Dynamin_N/PF00350_23/0_12Dynamin_N/PF00350_23/1_4AAA/PF00004_29/16